MTRDKIRAAIIEVLKEVQVIRGREWVDLKGNTTPINNLPDFDSLCALEATTYIEAKLGYSDPKNKSAFVTEDESGKRALTLDEVTQHVEQLIKESGGRK